MNGDKKKYHLYPPINLTLDFFMNAMLQKNKPTYA